jgi:lipopolysaccharide biosynthesis protein
MSAPDPVRLLAFFLPQFHPTPENDAWWGQGFTEWINVSRARPLLEGHYQPHLPADLGFYDLRVPEVREAQAALAREYGLSGFCYYHYWFNGRRLLHRPIDDILASRRPDFPFALCWANENWTRAWDGHQRDVLIAQEYSVEDDRAHLRFLLTAFRDPRYVRVEGKPLFLVYRSSNLPDSKATTRLWREEAAREGLELYLCRVEGVAEPKLDPVELGFDAAVEFQPDWKSLGQPMQPSAPAWLDRWIPRNRALRENRFFDYAETVRRMQARPQPGYRRFPCVMPGWDNAARRTTGATAFLNSSPEVFGDWLAATLTAAAREGTPIAFVNAWNEWAEGTHLEPDQRNGRAYLEAVRDALVRSGQLPEHARR